MLMKKKEAKSVNSASGVGSGSISNVVGERRGTANAVWIGRGLFILALVSVAAVLGSLAFYFLNKSEEDLAEAQYESIAEQALTAAFNINKRKRLGTISLASIASNLFPNADDWPFVTIHGFEEIATNLIATSSGQDMALCPLVTPQQLTKFEDFAYDYYEKSRKPPFPNGTAVSSFGKGVWGKNDSLGTSDNRYHETDGSTSYGSPNKVFTPVLQHNAGVSPVLMLNVHYQETRGRAIDSLIECEKRRMISLEPVECLVITDIIILTTASGPGALIMQPIFPANNLTTLTGLIASSIDWDEVLLNVFTGNVRGISCVLETETLVYTYLIWDGAVVFSGAGDLHETEYDDFRRSILLTGEGLFNNASAPYTLSLYPSRAYYNVYRTNNPAVATAGAVCCILFTSVLFFLYDFFVRRDINAKKGLLEAKRAFVRFVSHEVRTPLNSVCMGLTLMQEEIATSLGFATVEDLSKKAKQGIANEDTPGSQSSILECFRLSEDVLNNAQRSVGVLNDLLNYDKIEMGSLKLELTVLPVRDLIESTVNEFRSSASQKKISFSISFDQLQSDLQTAKLSVGFESPLLPQDCRTVGDSIRLAQVLRNLLSNAIKFTPEEGQIQVSVCWVQQQANARKVGAIKKFTLKTGEEISVPGCGSVIVNIVDNGAGMSEDQLAQLFGDGVQFNVNDLQAGNGTGLGLHIAKGIMEQHGGTLIASSPGLHKGTTFTFTLPLYHIPESDGGEKTEMYPVSMHSSSPDFDAMPLHVLVVDDAAMNRKLLSRLLRNHGHVCDEAEDGEVAVRLVKQAMADRNPYDTVLLDNEMPVMSGPDAAREMRSLGSDVFIVGVTGNLLAQDVALFRDSGANAILPKPFKLCDLECLWVEHGIHNQHKDDMP